MPEGSDGGGSEGSLPGGAIVRGTLIRPPPSVPASPLPKESPAPLAFGAASRSPGLILLLGCATAIARLGWVASAMVAATALRGELAALLPAIGLAATSSLLSGLLRLAVWAGGGP